MCDPSYVTRYTEAVLNSTLHVHPTALRAVQPSCCSSLAGIRWRNAELIPEPSRCT